MSRNVYQDTAWRWINLNVHLEGANLHLDQYKHSRDAESLLLEVMIMFSPCAGAISDQLNGLTCGSVTEIFTYNVDLVNSIKDRGKTIGLKMGFILLRTSNWLKTGSIEYCGFMKISVRSEIIEDPLAWKSNKGPVFRGRGRELAGRFLRLYLLKVQRNA